MTLEEAINMREEKLVEARKLRTAIRILESDSIPTNAGVTMAIGQYRKRLSEIDNEIRTLAEMVEKPVSLKVDLEHVFSKDELADNIIKLARLIASHSGNTKYRFTDNCD